MTLDVGATDRAEPSVAEMLLDAGAVEHVFTTATDDPVVYARVPNGDVADWLSGVLDGAGRDAVDDVEVTLLAGAEWSPDLGGTEFALICAECGNTVDSEGTAARVGGDLYQFCCPSCEPRFEEQYEQLKRGVD